MLLSPRSAVVVRPVLVAALALTLAACAGRGDDEPDRRDRLTMPPDLSGERIGQVPESRRDRGAAAMTAEQREEQERASRDVAPEPVGTRIRQQGAERWLQVQASPEQVWDGLNRWMEDEGVPVARSEQELGIIETGWMPRPMGPSGGVFLPLERDPEGAPLVDQYLIRVEAAEEQGMSEVFVAHRRVAAVDDGWAPRTGERGLEGEMLRAFMLYLGADEAFAAEQAAQREQRLTRMDTDEAGDPVLIVRESFLQTFQRVGLALDRAAFTVEERDRAQGRFLVRYDPAADQEDDGPGFFSRLAFWREREPELERGTYAIVIGRADDGTAVSVRSEEGERVSERLSERLLLLIDDQLR
ncbi:outer membrane protein assembly factor BamC [Aquisalimonas asiatica]|uniref:Beta-barrel assembly machine subunit BamC n=1 Tax=Aquisalimonas asiatica TaxID=406100 RepID=A0A1H8U1L1_9GAMM|nr:outer membrane protein assembly factor BamC [Aquisalimonas asiatica]SEO97139.1 Beta-barrel assembly machine subunit BamC [Aquisalimonas asiatica]